MGTSPTWKVSGPGVFPKKIKHFIIGWFEGCVLRPFHDLFLVLRLATFRALTCLMLAVGQAIHSSLAHFPRATFSPFAVVVWSTSSESTKRAF